MRLAVCSAALLAGTLPHMPAAQSEATQAVPAPKRAMVLTGTQQAYSLPPEKLAKAIAISRIRNILSITGSVWGLLFLWLLLASRALSGLERWAQRISDRRWIQGAIFFAAFLIMSALADMPLDWRTL
jgi:STE24 endopeptidase